MPREPFTAALDRAHPHAGAQYPRQVCPVLDPAAVVSYVAESLEANPRPRHVMNLDQMQQALLPQPSTCPPSVFALQVLEILKDAENITNHFLIHKLPPDAEDQHHRLAFEQHPR